jgi:hypothetical protein
VIKSVDGIGLDLSEFKKHCLQASRSLTAPMGLVLRIEKVGGQKIEEEERS